MATGASTPITNLLMTAPESAPGVLLSTGGVTLRTDVDTDGNGPEELQRFETPTPDGFFAPLDVQLLDDAAQVSGTWMPAYDTADDWASWLAGQGAGAKTSGTLADGRAFRRYKLPEMGRVRDLVTLHAWYGGLDQATELFYGKLVELSLEAQRSGNVGGNFTLHFNRYLRNQLSPNSVAQTNIFTLTFANAWAAQEFRLSKPSTLTGAVTFTPGQSGLEAALKAGLEALYPGTTFTVTATTALTGTTTKSGVLTVTTAQNVSIPTPRLEQGTVFRLRANPASGNYTLNGSATFAPGDTAAAIQTKVQATGGDFAAASVAGISAAATGGTVNSYIVSGAGDTSYNGTYTDNGTVVNGAPVYQMGSGAAARYLSKYTSGGGWVLSPTGTAIANPSPSAPYSNNGTGSTPPTGAYQNNGGTAPAPSVAAGAATGGTAGEFDLKVFIPIAAAPTALPAATGTGATVEQMLAFGPAGASLKAATTQPGGDGSGPDVPDTFYLAATHARIYKAISYADLQTINMGTATTEAPADDPHLVRTALAHGVSFGNLVAPVSHEIGQVEPDSHVDLVPEINVTLTLEKRPDGHCEDLYSSDRAGGCGVKPFYIRQAYRCGQRELWIDVYGRRNQAPDRPNQDNVESRQFTLGRAFNPDGSVIITVVDPLP